MQAVIRIGAHQYWVKPGQTITVEKLDGPVGSDVLFRDILMYADGESVKVGPEAAGTVHGTIKTQYRAPKIDVFKKKRRKGYTKRRGHRQPYTRVEITRIEA